MRAHGWMLSLTATAVLGCGEETVAPMPAPSFEIATDRLVMEGPFSFRDRIGDDFEPFDLNDRGDVVGFIPGVGWGVLPGDGGPLAPLPPIVVGGATAPATITLLNQLGVAAGVVTDFLPSGVGRSRPLLWSPGSAPEIGPYLPGESGGEAVGITVLDVNDAGLVVGGFGDDPLRGRLPYRWTSGAAAAELLDAGTADAGDAVAINSTGLTAGYLRGPAPTGFNGAFWSPAGELTSFPEAGILYDLNEGGQIAGRTPDGLCSLWDADRSIRFQAPCPLVVFGAVAVNESGHFLYLGGTDVDPTVRHRLWVEGAEPAALPPWPGADLTLARALNNRGMIVGLGRAADFSFIEPVFWTYRIEPVPPDELVEDLADAVDAAEAAGTLGSGNANALRAKLDAASRHLAAGRCAAAEGVLEAFVNQVDALERSGTLSAAEAADLRDAANAAIAEIAATCTGS